MNITNEQLIDFENRYKDVDEADGNFQRGDVVYVKYTGKFNAVYSRTMFLDTVEIDTHKIHFGGSGYCYNGNIIRIPRSALSKEDKEEVLSALKS